ncbi:ribosome biogenesis GTPase YlqF [Saccharibacillus deserti]|uniref:ribosome biogenesis GTPase YlqF n=1 Tax=Saccharibacillus deserti TaxID=1634444 RepID=UPI001551ACF7|nr:ribosome biogenesis GTPase YlqF [Saccharibacillus deserti]
MTIQWFPGHMTRARRQIEAKLSLIDLAIELLDARLPLSSRNPMIGDILKDKPRLILLNKSDLADPEMTKKWIDYFREEGHTAIETDSSGGRGMKDISIQAKLLLQEKIDRQIAKGMNPRAIRALIVGIPNVGKSTLINRLAGKSIAETGDRPGVTKGQQWIKVGKEMELLDTPGILWPKFEDQNVGMKLAVTGAIKEDVLNVEEVTFFAIKYFAEHYWGRLSERFVLGERPETFDDADEIIRIMEAIGRKRGCLMSGGRVDLQKASILFLRELRSGKMGRFSLEEPF